MNGGFLSLVKAVTSCCIFTSVLLRTQDSAWIVLGSSWLAAPALLPVRASMGRLTIQSFVS
jgi:hypothetical protein